jgi:hypothetical protein
MNRVPTRDKGNLVKILSVVLAEIIAFIADGIDLEAPEHEVRIKCRMVNDAKRHTQS